MNTRRGYLVLMLFWLELLVLTVGFVATMKWLDSIK